FVLASTLAAVGGTEVRVQLVADVRYEVYHTPDARGFQMVVAFTEPGPTALASDLDAAVDPGPGGSAPGVLAGAFGSETTLTLGFAERLAAALRQRGLGAELTRDSDYALDVSSRWNAGVGADLFISVHVGDLPSGDFNAYYLA